MFYEISKVKVAEEFYMAEEVHTNCNHDDINEYKNCNVIDGFLTCSRSQCGDYALKCVCHVVTDMGG